ncbi:MAG: hypothetical protein HY437_02320 [Candidatus Magasanikbacteria bacterium]|nr:hypothetical protein [Candidatus Magasanikbacteria bacterium]
MSERPEPKPHHHALLWAGVIGCLLLVGGFWIAGLPDVFQTGSKNTVFSDAGKELERIVAEANKTLARFKETEQPASDERTKTLARFKETITQLLSEAAAAEALKADVVTSTATTTIE